MRERRVGAAADPGARWATTTELPGRLILVVGPSGAGKDTLIEAARRTLARDQRYVFPRRIITRPASAAENNIVADESGFLGVRDHGGFALAWSAHGHWYGIPAAIDADLARGAHVVINVSRTVVAEARRRWPDVTVIEVTAPADVLARRIAARDRPSDAAGTERLGRRLEPGETPLADAVIDNGRDLETAVAAFLAAIVAP